MKINCPGGCGLAFMRTSSDWLLEGEVVGETCPRCGIELDEARKALFQLRILGWGDEFFDPIATLQNLTEWALAPDAPRAVFYASHLAHLACGHSRPVTRKSHEVVCPLCQTASEIEWVEPTERQAFPHEDSLSVLEGA